MYSPRVQSMGRVSTPLGTDEQAGSVRLRILRGAAAVFGQRGYNATSVEAILDEARVSRRTFYKYFRSKEDVLRVLFENAVAVLLGAVREAQRSAAPGEGLQAGIEAYVGVHVRAGPLARVLLFEQFSPSSPLAQQRDAAMGAFAQLIADNFARTGRTPPDPLLIHGVVAAINQIAVQMASEHPEGDWDVERAKGAMLRLLRALSPPGAA